MLTAALLFVAGIVLGWNYNVLALLLSSAVLFFGSIILFLIFYEFGALQLLLTFAYLLAHQSGYLVGAYISFEGEGED
ncbi:hypothetical protein ACU4GR_33795 (plasmid) [Methylobacterium oryzae CBMB20]